MTAILIFAIILGPMTALLIWVVICELRGVPAFTDSPAPQPGELDALGRWILGAVCLVLAVAAYALGGALAVLAFASAIAALAACIAAAWTLGQSVNQLLRRRAANRNGVAMPGPLPPPHRRFALNFRRTIIQLPLFFVGYG